MANKTLLDAVNETLKRANVIDTANTTILTSLTQSNVQHNIDIAIQVINEGIDELYTATETDLPAQEAQSTITIVTGQREYSLAANLVKLKWPLEDITNTQYIAQWEGSYNDFLIGLDPNQNMTGLPIWAIISPITNMLRLDRAPDSSLNGRIYTYQYNKDTILTLATDNVPFNNLVFRAMVPCWVQLYKREMRNEFDQALYTLAIGRAARTVTEEPYKLDYSPRRGYPNFSNSDPFVS